MRTENLTPDEKRDKKQKDAQHVFYEWDMLNFCADWIQCNGSTSQPRLCYAVLTSFVVHARNLVFFFWDYVENPDEAQKPRKSRKPHKDDIVATDYYSDWEKIRPNQSPLLAETVIRVHKLAVHLTSTRTTLAPEWQGLLIRDELRIVWDEFERVAGDTFIQDPPPWWSVVSEDIQAG